jgi:hypothetical protein
MTNEHLWASAEKQKNTLSGSISGAFVRISVLMG